MLRVPQPNIQPHHPIQDTTKLLSCAAAQQQTPCRTGLKMSPEFRMCSVFQYRTAHARPFRRRHRNNPTQETARTDEMEYEMRRFGLSIPPVADMLFFLIPVGNCVSSSAQAIGRRMLGGTDTDVWGARLVRSHARACCVTQRENWRSQSHDHGSRCQSHTGR